jgi:hypothetical protein
MKRKARLAILGAMLQGSAHAAEPSVTAEPSLNELITHSLPAAEKKKTKVVRGKKVKPETKVDTVKIDQQAKIKQDGVTETPPGSIEQSIQLRGVRG